MIKSFCQSKDFDQLLSPWDNYPQTSNMKQFPAKITIQMNAKTPKRSRTNRIKTQMPPQPIHIHSPTRHLCKQSVRSIAKTLNLTLERPSRKREQNFQTSRLHNKTLVMRRQKSKSYQIQQKIQSTLCLDNYILKTEGLLPESRQIKQGSPPQLHKKELILSTQRNFFRPHRSNQAQQNNQKMAQLLIMLREQFNAFPQRNKQQYRILQQPSVKIKSDRRGISSLSHFFNVRNYQT